MKMNSVVIRTDNIEKSLAFYKDVVGLTFESMISAAPGKRIAFLYDSHSGNRLEIIQNERFKQKPVHSVSLTFVVDQIGETQKYLQSKGVPIIMAPRTVKDGKKILTATDPNGVEIDFIELRRAP